MKKAIMKVEEKKMQDPKEHSVVDRGGGYQLTEGEVPCPDTHDNIIICTECPNEPRFCSLCICAHKEKKHNGGLKHLKEKIITNKEQLLKKLEEKKKIAEEYRNNNEGIIKCFDGAQVMKKKVLAKSQELFYKMEEKKTTISNKFIKIQGEITNVLHNLRGSLGNSKQSIEKIVELNQEIDIVQKEKGATKVDYRKLYKSIEACLDEQHISLQKELQGVMNKIGEWNTRMDTLTEEIDCELVTKKELKLAREEKNGFIRDLNSKETQKKKMEEEIKELKEMVSDHESTIDKFRVDIQALKENLASLKEALSKEKAKCEELAKLNKIVEEDIIALEKRYIPNRKQTYIELCAKMGSNPDLVKLREEVKIKNEYSLDGNYEFIPIEKVAAVASGLIYNGSITNFEFKCKQIPG